MFTSVSQLFGNALPLCIVVAALTGCKSLGSLAKSPYDTAETATAAVSNRDDSSFLETYAGPPSPIGVVQVRFSAGFVHETPKEHGAATGVLARLLGESHSGLRHRVEQTGVRLKAWVEPTGTVYSLEGPSANLSRAVTEFLNAFSQKNWSHNRSIPQRSFRRQTATHRLIRLAYGVHAFGNGPPRMRTTMTEDQLARFVQRTYMAVRPKIVVVSNQHREAIVNAVRANMGPWSRQTTRAEQEIIGKQTSVITVDTHDQKFATIHLAIACAVKSPQEAAVLDLAVQSLVQPEHGLLQALVKQAGSPIYSARAFAYSPGQDSRIVVELTVSPKEIDDAWQRVFSLLVSLTRSPLSESDFVRAVRSLSSQVAILDSHPSSFARHMGQLQHRWSNGKLAHEQWTKSVAQLSPKSLRDWWSSVVHPSRISAVVTGSKGQSGLDQTLYGESLLERAKRILNPAPETQEVGLIKIQDGLQIVLHPIPGSKAVTTSYHFANNQKSIPTDLKGVDLLIGRALATRMAKAHAKSTVGDSGITVTSTWSADELSSGLATMNQLTIRPNWSPAELEIARTQAMDELRHRQKNAFLNDLHQLVASVNSTESSMSIASNEWIQSLYDLSYPQVSAWYRAHITDAPKVIVIVGDFDSKVALRVIKNAFGATDVSHSSNSALTGLQASTLNSPHASKASKEFEWSATVWPKLDAPSLEKLKLFSRLLNEKISATQVKKNRSNDSPYAFVYPTRDALLLVIRIPETLKQSIREIMHSFATDGIEPNDLVDLRTRHVHKELIQLSRADKLSHWLHQQVRLNSPWIGRRCLEQWQAFAEGLTSQEMKETAKIFLAKNTRRVTIGGASAPTTKDTEQ